MKIDSTPRHFSDFGAGCLLAASAARSGIYLSIGVIALLSLQSSHAASSTWTNLGGGNWNTGGNWSGGSASGSNNFADFSTLNLTADQILTLDADFIIGDLLFGDATTPSHNWTLNATPGSVLTLKNNGTPPLTADINVVNQTTTIDLVLDTKTVETIQKLGSGTLILKGANTISSGSTTNVVAGTLLANNASGSATGLGSVSVGLLGKLGGNGIITPGNSNNISVSGILAPGGPIGATGNLTFGLGGTSVSATMNSGSSFEYDLGVEGLTIAAFGTSDLLTIAGAGVGNFTFNGNNIDFLNTGAVGYYKLFDTDSDNANTWSGLTFNGSTGVITGGLSYTNLAGSLTADLLVGTVDNGGTPGDIYLHVIPEPGAALLGGLGMLALLRRRRNV